MSTPSDEPVLFRAGELARRLGAALRGDPGLGITRVDAIESAGPAGLSFARDAARLAQWRDSSCGAALVSQVVADADPRLPAPPPGRALIVVADADLAMASVLEWLAPREQHAPGVHPRAVVDPGATIDPSASIGPGVVVGPQCEVGEHAVLCASVTLGRGVRVGPRSVLHPGVVVQDRCVIGAGVTLHPGVVVGADGFGYRPSPDGRGLLKVPHIGRVVIEDGVEIGANATIDRAKFGDTLIGAGTKIDNLVQIGHNCRVGRSCIICGCAALAGSVTLGDGVVIAGGVGIADNRTIGAGARIGARSGVMDDIPAGESWVGYPARPARHTMRLVAALEQLPDLLSRFKRMKDPGQG